MRPCPRLLPPLLVTIALATACGGSSSGATDPGRRPSEQAAMICEPEAAEDIASGLRIKTIDHPAPGWEDDDYTCTYHYAAGAEIVLRVRDLADDQAADKYLGDLGRRLRRTSQDITFGTQGAFATPDGSVAVEKDSHVLFVDVSRLPEMWSDPPLPRSSAASIVAAAIMGCWTGDG